MDITLRKTTFPKPGIECPRHWFETARETVPAYKQVVGEWGLGNFRPSSIADWDKLPVLDKKNYVARFPPNALCPNGRMGAVAHASSGTTGEPTFWFRGPKQKRIGIAYYARVIDDVIRIPHIERTLVVVCFGMGVWVAGTYTLLAFEQLGCEEQRNLTVVPPGMEAGDVASIVSRLACQFNHVVLAGYPLALDHLFQELKLRDVPPPEKLHLITSGDRISEDWRDLRMNSQRIAQPTSVISVYGCADAGLLAIETPLSIEIRRKLCNSTQLGAQILGSPDGIQPALFQYDPDFFFFEEVDGELLFSADLDVPLIRYNIHDRGKVIPYSEMMRLVEPLEIENSVGWELPFVVVSCRSDVALVLYGAKIYPEALRLALQDPQVRSQLSGSFVAYSSESEYGQEFGLHLELARGLTVKNHSSLMIANLIQERLLQFSSEYRNSCLRLGKDTNRPRVILFQHGDSQLINFPRLSAGDVGTAYPPISAFFSPATGKPRVLNLRPVSKTE
jgi:phenylacetate-CoA ligase